MLFFILGSIVLPAVGRCDEGALLLDSASLLYGVCSHGNGVLCADGFLDGCGGNAQRYADGVSWLSCICPERAGGSRLQSTWGNHSGVKMEWGGWAG